MASDIGIGLVGAGHMNETYAECVTNWNKGTKLVAVGGGTRAPKLAAVHGVDAEPDVESLLLRDDVDAVIVATPHQTLVDYTIAAAERGKHVLVENPMGTNVADCNAAIAACKKAGVNLSVIKTLRFRGTFSRTKELIDQGRIGDVLMMGVTSLWALADSDKQPWSELPESGSYFWARGTHIFDATRWLVGRDATAVFGNTMSTAGIGWQAPSAMVQVTFEGGAGAQVWASHEVPKPAFPDSQYRFRIWGEKGMIDADGFGKLRIATAGEWEDVWEQPPIFSAANPTQSVMTPERLLGYYTQIQDFVDSINGGRSPVGTGEDGKAAVEMAEAAHLSALTGSSVKLPLPHAKGGHQFDGATVDRSRIPG